MSHYTYHDFLANLGIGGAHPGGISLTKEILQEELINQNTHILDAGCGTGQTSAYLAQTYGCQVTAIDSHPLMIKKAQQRFTKDRVNVNVVQGNIENLPFSDNLFDLILVESVTVFTNIAKSCSEFSRLLRKGGTLIDLEMTAISPFSEDETEEFQKVYGIAKIPTVQEWKNQYVESGFHSFEVKKEKSVALEINQPSLTQDSTVLPEFHPSDPIDPLLYEIWNDHQLLTEKYANYLTYNVYRVKV
jgi:ubiquinone/menaquinone biosynthesis C-methylase UbiE